MKTCKGCLVSKPLTDFQKQGQILRSRCRSCYAGYARIKRHKRIRAGLCISCDTPVNGTRMCERHLKSDVVIRTQYKRSITKAVLTYYGGKCVCCGEQEEMFLSIDHINNDGSAHRKSISQGNLYRWIIKNGFPNTLQLMCMNCNSGKYRNHGTCPHDARSKDNGTH